MEIKPFFRQWNSIHGNFTFWIHWTQNSSVFPQNIIDSTTPPPLDVFNKRIREENKLSFLSLYGSTLKGHQKNIYMNEVVKYEGLDSLQIDIENKLLQLMSSDKRIPLISATGSTRMGKSVGEVVGGRLGKSLLELGGNNAVILTPNADLKMVIPALVFGAVGTTGQRCTSTRRLIIHQSIYNDVKAALVNAYGQLKIGNPLDESNHVGPLIDQEAFGYLKGENGVHRRIIKRIILL